MKKILFAVVLAAASTSMAADCVVKIKRDACPGKEKAAYKPYNGAIETEEKPKVADAAACKAEAEKLVKIVRKGTLTKKTVNYTFDGKAGETMSDTAECK